MVLSAESDICLIGLVNLQWTMFVPVFVDFGGKVNGGGGGGVNPGIVAVSLITVQLLLVTVFSPRENCKLLQRNFCPIWRFLEIIQFFTVECNSRAIWQILSVLTEASCMWTVKLLFLFRAWLYAELFHTLLSIPFSRSANIFFYWRLTKLEVSYFVCNHGFMVCMY